MFKFSDVAELSLLALERRLKNVQMIKLRAAC